MAQGLADIATIGLLQQRTVTTTRAFPEQLQSALNSRIIIEQAKGTIAERAGIQVEAALELMRTYSRRERRLLRETAGAIIDGELTSITSAAPACTGLSSSHPHSLDRGQQPE